MSFWNDGKAEMRPGSQNVQTMMAIIIRERARDVDLGTIVIARRDHRSHVSDGRMQQTDLKIVKPLFLHGSHNMEIRIIQKALDTEC